MSEEIAIEMTGYGGPEVLVPVRRPARAPGEGEVAVRAVVCGVNRADLFIRSGAWPIGGPFPYVPGLEVAGIVEAVGPGESDLQSGEPVITMMQRLGGIHGTRPGGYQTRVVVPASTLVRVPDGLEVSEAGALGLPFVTALLSLDRLDPPPRGRVLVHAGSSAVGMMALQILRARGAHVIATSTSAEKFDAIRAAGATEVVSTREQRWHEQVGRVDAVLDLVGRATFAASVGALVPGGRLVFAGGTTGGDLSFSGWDLMRPVTLTGYSSESLTQSELASAVASMASLSQRGLLRASVLHRFPLARAADAHRALSDGHLAGRVVLLP
jgi:NADPH2:quinone reductase